MANYKHYFNNGFAGCRLLAHAHDNHRDRSVRVYQIPGEVECVGVTDGVDKWIAPVIANPFSLNIGDLIKRLASGEQIKLPVNADPPAKAPVKSTRRALLPDSPTQPPPKPRRALLVDPGEPQAPSPRRRVII